MSDDQDQQQGQAQPAALPKAHGPLVDVTLPDGQQLYAVVKARVREPDGWWYDLQIHLPHQGSERRRLLSHPAAADFRPPAALCKPIDGQPNDQVPTKRPDTTPAWKVEQPVYSTGDTGPTSYADQVRGLLDRTPYERALLTLFADLVKTTGDGRVADVGCGSGRITAYLRGLGVDTFGIDLSPAMTEVARRDHPGLRFEVGSMTEPRPPRRLDGQP